MVLLSLLRKLNLIQKLKDKYLYCNDNQLFTFRCSPLQAVTPSGDGGRRGSDKGLKTADYQTNGVFGVDSLFDLQVIKQCRLVKLIL